MKLGTNTLCLILIVNVYVASMKIQDGGRNQRWPPQKKSVFFPKFCLNYLFNGMQFFTIWTESFNQLHI